MSLQEPTVKLLGELTVHSYKTIVKAVSLVKTQFRLTMATTSHLQEQYIISFTAGGPLNPGNPEGPH